MGGGVTHPLCNDTTPIDPLATHTSFSVSVNWKGFKKVNFQIDPAFGRTERGPGYPMPMGGGGFARPIHPPPPRRRSDIFNKKSMSHPHTGGRGAEIA